MISKVGLNTAEDKKNYFVKHGIIGGAVPAIIAGAIGTGVDVLATKHAMKDEFKSAKQAVKDAKAQNLGKEAIKEAKKGVKKLNSEAVNQTLKGLKKAAWPIAAAIASITLFKGLIFPAIEEYLNNDKKAGK